MQRSKELKNNASKMCDGDGLQNFLATYRNLTYIYIYIHIVGTKM
jgi:hypothetical protein